MLFSEKKIILKDGSEAVLRSPTKADAADMARFVKSIASETDFTLRTPEEYAALTVEAEATSIEKINASQNVTSIICTLDGRLCANCNLQLNLKTKIRHRASIGIAVYKEFWGRGIGGAMIDEMIALAKKLGVTQLELTVMGSNSRAISLYERKGFSAVAVLPNAYRTSDGQFLSQITMIRAI